MSTTTSTAMRAPIAAKHSATTKMTKMRAARGATTTTRIGT